MGRIDRDHATLEHLNETLRDAQNDQLDILFGTQMIAKGLDLKNITLVGIINADELLAGTDYQSQERAVSLMMQAAGRAGRGSKAGRVLLQTKQPTLPLLRMIVSQDWPRFVRQELERRKEFHYPPFRYLLRASFTHHNEARAKNQAQQLRQQLPDNPQVEILGPSTPLIARVRNRFTYQYVFKASRRAALVEIARNLPKDWVPDLDPISIL